MPEQFEFDTIEALDTLMSSLRIRMLETFVEPATIKECAEAMGVSVTRLYRHVHRLVEHGFLEVLEERKVGRTTEKVYRTAGRSVGPSVAFSKRYGAEGSAEMLRLLFRTVETEVVGAVQEADLSEPSDSRAFTYRHLSLDEEQLATLLEELNDLTSRYSEKSGDIDVSFFSVAFALNLNDH